VREPRGVSPAYRAIYDAVRRVPRGRVATYGQIASLAGLDGHARLVGYALHALPDDAPVPWHRVVNAKGTVSRRRSGSGHDVLQRKMLEREGVKFDREGRLSLAVFRWRPRSFRRPGGSPETATPPPP
jgi:methylated-DNA-protein-cysteine methyltransferase-like protein